MNEGMTIGKAARMAGVSVQAIRYYERRDILPPDRRRESGYRLYGGEAVRKLRFIKNAQELGFSLREIAGLLRLRVSDRARCGDVKRRAEAKIADVHDRISCLRTLEAALKDLVRACRRRSQTDACPILRSLEMQRSGLCERYTAKTKTMPAARGRRSFFGISRRA